MAIKKVMIGSLGPYLYDDSLPIIDPDFNGVNQGGIITTGIVHADEGYSASGGGASGSITIVTDIRNNAGTIEKKTRSLTFTYGQITTIGAESDWTAI
jgi:hypothetical protein